jgi:hypothetical protein
MTDTVALAPYRTTTLPAARRAGYKPVRMPVEALIRQLPADGSVACIWERIGQTANGLEYRTTNVRATDRGIEVVCPGRDGLDLAAMNPADVRVVLVYPRDQGRTVRMLVRA